MYCKKCSTYSDRNDYCPKCGNPFGNNPPLSPEEFKIFQQANNIQPQEDEEQKPIQINDNGYFINSSIINQKVPSQEPVEAPVQEQYNQPMMQDQMLQQPMQQQMMQQPIMQEQMQQPTQQPFVQQFNNQQMLADPTISYKTSSTDMILKRKFASLNFLAYSSFVNQIKPYIDFYTDLFFLIYKMIHMHNLNNPTPMLVHYIDANTEITMSCDMSTNESVLKLQNYNNGENQMFNNSIIFERDITLNGLYYPQELKIVKVLFKSNIDLVQRIETPTSVEYKI